MEGYWVIANIAHWVVTIILGLVVLAHSRLIGQLHHRLSPSAARPLADGPAVGSRIGDLKGRALDGAKWVHAFPADRDVLLVFISPFCELCSELAPHLLDFSSAHREVNLVLASTLDDQGMNQAFVRYRRLGRVAYYMASELADEMGVTGTPYAILVDAEGVIVRKGLVNHYEHLRSMIEFREPEKNGGQADSEEGSGEEVHENG